MLSTTTVTRNANRTGAETELTQEEVFNVLSNRRRRYVIHALKREEAPMEVSDLATRVTAWELGKDPEDVVYEDRRNVHSTLTRTHLPTLEEKNIIHLNEETNVVEPTAVLDDLDIYVEVLRNKEIPWSTYYVGLSAVAGALLLAVHTEAAWFGAVSSIDVAVFTVTAFIVSAAVHQYYGRHTRLGREDKPPEARHLE